MVSNYIGIERVIEKINRFKIPGGYWNIEEIKEWTYDTLEAINDKHAKVKASVNIEVVDNKAKLPAEIQSIHYVYDINADLELKEVLPHRSLDNYTYLINQGYMYTNLTNTDGIGRLTINYYTVPLDENGNPLIPDNRFYIAAIEAYLQYMIGKRAYWSGKILERQLTMLAQEYYYCLPQAQAEGKMDIMKDPQRFRRIHNKFML